MSSFIAWFVASLVIATLARFSGGGFPFMIAVSTGGGMVVGQLWVKWMQHGATSFPHVTALLTIFAVGIGFGFAGASVAYLLQRVLMRKREASSTDAEVAPRGGRPGRRPTKYVTKKESSPVQNLGMVAISIALVALAGPYLSVGNRGWAPLATIDPSTCFVMAVALLAWFVCFLRNWQLVALSLGTLVCCLAWLLLSGGPQQIFGEPTRIFGGWLLGLSGVALVVCPVIKHLAHRKEQQPSLAPQWIRLGTAIAMPIVLLVGVSFAMLNWSESSRAAMHPSPQVAFSDWAALHWSGPWKREERKGILEHILIARMSAYPEWWSKTFPVLLKDSDPALRLAAIYMNVRANPPIPWSESQLNSLMRDPEPRLREAGVRAACSMKAAVPEVEVLNGAVEALFIVDAEIAAGISPQDLEAWVGHERMVEVFAEVVMRSDGRALNAVQYELESSSQGSVDATKLVPEVLDIIIKDQDPVRRSRGLRMVEKAVYDRRWMPPQSICGYIKKLKDHPGDIGAEATRVLDGIERRDCCRQQ